MKVYVALPTDHVDLGAEFVSAEGVAARQPAREVTFRNQWGEPAGFVDDGPLWPDG